MQAQIFDTSKSITQKIESEDLKKRGISLYIKRDDLIHPEVSGNKWRKLMYNFEQFNASKKECILTFGGAFSNHLLAVASSCKLKNIPSIGIVRGEELTPTSNQLLSKCTELGMQLHFVNRMEYMMRNDKEYLEETANEFPNSFIIPEGGANYLGIIGCQVILNELNVPIDHLFVAQGTTTTSCGILMNDKFKMLHVVPVMKGFDAIGEMNALFKKTGIDQEYVEERLGKVKVHSEFHFGGYGKYTPELINFIKSINEKWNFPLDKIYTGKAFFALMNEIQKGNLDNQSILFIHTGGLHESVNQLDQ